MKLKVFFILIINLSGLLSLKAQSVSDVVQFANNEFEQGNYAIAAKEYNRAMFFGSENQDILSLQIAKCYSELNQLDLATDFYNKAYRLSQNDSIKNEALLGNTFCLLLQEKYILALSELFNVSDEPSKGQNIQFHFLKGIAHYGLQEDSLAYEEFAQTLQISGATAMDQEELKAEFGKVFKYHKRYNPNRTYVMSGILPGSGQLSIGAIKEGVNSMLLIGGLYLIAVAVIQHYSFWDAAIALFPWVQRYYLGGMDKAKELAVSKIASKRHDSYLKIIELSTPETYE